jgi:hypothetical protein
MNLNGLAQKVAALEEGKKEVNIAQIKEIIKVISVIMYENPSVIKLLISSGERNRRKKNVQTNYRM